ncbi:SdrD B-like domain-containing protein [Yoonia sp.]|uniref:DUF7507 domain-containing protein n=1 Tax=Yoonia sp. TaxID=2212373 RepID=UPI00358ECDE9
MSLVSACKRLLSSHLSQSLLIALLATMAIGVAPSQAQAQVYDLLVDIDDNFTIGTPPNEVVVDSTSLPAGDVARLKFRVSNNGPGAAPATTIDITVDGTVTGPLTLVGQEGTITNCVAAGGVVTCDVPALDAPVETPAGSGIFPATFEEVILDFQTTIAETVEIEAAVPLGPAGPNGENQNTLGNNDLTEVITVLEGVDMFVEWDVPATVPAGSFFDYTVRVRNVGPNTADSYRLTVPVPAGVVNITPPPGCSLQTSGTQQNYVCNVTADLAPTSETGPFVAFTFNGQIAVATGSEISTSVNVDNASPLDPNPANDDDVFSLDVTTGSDVAITKTRSPSGGPIFVEDTVTFTIGATYIGDTPTSIRIEDLVPSEYRIVSVNPGNYDCGLAPFFVGQVVDCTASGTGDGDPDGDGFFDYGDIVIEAVVESASDPAPVTNTATVTPQGVTEANTGNNTASDGPIVLQDPTIDLAVTKTGPAVPAIQNIDGYTFSLRAQNLGTQAYDGPVIITDSLPAGVTATGASGANWSCQTPNPSNPTGPLIPIVYPIAGPVDLVCTNTYSPTRLLNPNAQTSVLSVTISSQTLGLNTNRASVNGPDADPLNNDTDNDTFDLDFETVLLTESADVSVAKRSGVPIIDPNDGSVSLSANTTATAGEPYAFEIEVFNDGPAAAVGVNVLDTIRNLQNGNANFESISIDGTGSCSQDSRSGSSARLNCLVDVPLNCVAGSTCPVITAVVIPGRDAGRGVDPSDPSDGTRNNTVTVSPTVTPDPDPSNNSASVDFPFIPRSDVTVTKAAPATVSTGVNLTYTVTARNLPNGLSRADGVEITDTLPLGVRFISATAQGGGACTAPLAGSTTTPTNRIVQCELGNLNLGQQRAVTIVVRPNYDTFDQSGGANAIINDVRVDLFDGTGAIVTTPFDVDPNNNTASVSTTLAPPDLDIAVDKFDSADPLAVGDPYTYTVRVDNLGPSAAQNVLIRDQWPTTTKIDFVSIAPPFDTACSLSGTIADPGEITCNIGYMEARDRVDIVFNVIARESGTVQNTVAVDSDEIVTASETGTNFDRESVNNDTQEETTIASRTDLILQSKTASSPTVNLGDTFTYSAIVTVSDVFGEADDVVFSDLLPDDMELAGNPEAFFNGSATPIADSCTAPAPVGNFTFSCQLGSLFPLDVVEIIIPVRVTAVDSYPQTFTNEAVVSTSSIERGTALNNNEAEGDVDVVSSTIAGNIYRDFDDDQNKDTGDTDISGVPVTLTGTNSRGETIAPITINTDVNGNFLFEDLEEGIYTITRGDPGEPYLVDGTNTAGEIDGGAQTGTAPVGPNTIVDIVLPDDSDSINNIFRVIPQARVGLAKSGVIDSLNDDGTFNATYTFVVENFSLEDLDQIVIADDLSGAAPALGTYQPTGPLAKGAYRIVTAPDNGCGTGNAGFTGAPGGTTISTGGTLLATTLAGPPQTCTVTFTVQVFPTDDRINGPFNNQAEVTANGVLSGQTPTDLSDDGDEPDANGNGTADEAGENDPTVLTPNAVPSIALVKTAELPVLPRQLEENDDITYTFTVTNTGDLTLTGIEVRDVMISDDVIGTIAVLAPGASDSVTATYPITQDDLDAGEVVNTATAIGTDPFGREPTDDSGTEVDNDTDTTTSLTREPAIDLQKTAVISGDQMPTQVGDVITYTFTITNIGNVTLTDVTLTDDLEGLVFLNAPIDPIPSLAPGASDATTYRATYTVDEDDILVAGQVVNQALVSGTPPEGDDVEDLSGPEPRTDADTIVPLTRLAAIETTKTQVLTDNGDGVDSVGDLITYTITVENTGNVPLFNVGVADTLTDLIGGDLDLTSEPAFASASEGSDEGELLVGEIATYTATYEIELEAVNAGGVSNTVLGTAEGLAGSGPPGDPVPVSDVSDDGIDTDGDTESDPTELRLSPFVSATGLSMTKTTPLDLVQRGDVVPYTIVLTNENTFVEGFLDVVDRLPNGMIYIPGSATIDGAPADVTFTAGRVTWSDVTVPALGTVTFTLDARILNGARAGSLVNRVSLIDPTTGDRVISDATATVRIAPEAVFECSDIVGKVFNDVNGNGYQDAPDTVGRGMISDQSYDGGKGKLAEIIEPRDETGLPGVRLATVDGMVITTDENGLFSVPCAALPATGGENFILKVDERSLPAGYRMTTENPRVTRITPGTMTEMNFGAAVALQVVRVDLTAASFVQTSEGTAMSPALSTGLTGVLQEIAGSPSNMVLTFHLPQSADAADVAAARQLLDTVEDKIRRDWRDIGRVRLRIEQSIVRAGQ